MVSTAPVVIGDAEKGPEAQYAQHGNKAHTDGEFGPIPVQTRNERFKSYDVNAFEAVSARDIFWKLTPLDRIAALTSGTLDGSPYGLVLPQVDGVEVEWIDRTDARVGSVGTPEDRASANAWSSFDKALSITLKGEEYSEVTIARTGLGAAARAAHTVITAEPFSNSIVILEGEGSANLSENVEILIGESAKLTVVTVQDWDDDASHLAAHFASVGRDAQFKHVVVSLGGGVVRINPSTVLADSGADGELLGVYFADAGQHLEQQVFLFHKAANTKGRVAYKGALQGQGARTVWIGDVLIGHEASGTDSYESNRNLVLTEGTRADSIPNLEIETGDIMGAGHASATGRFDDEQLFYLQARGITEEEARRLVVRGFLAEIVQKIGYAPLEERLHLAIEQELSAGTAL